MAKGFWQSLRESDARAYVERVREEENQCWEEFLDWQWHQHDLDFDDAQYWQDVRAMELATGLG